MSGNAHFIEDTFDSDKRMPASGSKAVNYCDVNEATSDEESDDRDNGFGDKGMNEQAPEPSSTKERPQ